MTDTPDFQGTHLWDRLCWAKENLEPFRTEYCVVWEDHIEFGDHSVSLMLDNEFPPTKAAMFLLAAMIQEDPISPPDCPHCSEED